MHALRAIEDEGPETTTVLVVDDDPAFLRLYARQLEAEGFAVERTSDPRAAVEILRGGRIDVVVTDLEMPSMSGIDLLRAAHELDPELPVLIVTGSPEVPSAAAAVEHGAFRYLCKPLSTDELVAHLQSATDVRRPSGIQRVPSIGPDGLPRSESRIVLEGNVRRALESLWMAHQPIVDARSRRLFAYEALLRTREPSIPHPGAFLDAARKVGVQRELGRSIRAWVARAMHGLRAGVSVFVNLSAADLLDDELLDRGAPLTELSHRVVLELTERVGLDRVGDVQARIERLRELGFRIAIDDLGAGYASLNSLAMVHPDVVKVDMSLVRGVDRDETKRKLVATILGLCEELGIVTVCEGVETDDERETLESLGRPLLQGWRFGRPGEGYPEPKW
jgi:EAL domain-containing protein (putative c-di-GMP-specific phosphodiesterase class I)/ActR/RegA family two-component response regulator